MTECRRAQRVLLLCRPSLPGQRCLLWKEYLQSIPLCNRLLQHLSPAATPITPTEKMATMPDFLPKRLQPMTSIALGGKRLRGLLENCTTLDLVDTSLWQITEDLLGGRIRALGLLLCSSGLAMANTVDLRNRRRHSRHIDQVTRMVWVGTVVAHRRM